MNTYKLSVTVYPFYFDVPKDVYTSEDIVSYADEAIHQLKIIRSRHYTPKTALNLAYIIYVTDLYNDLVKHSYHFPRILDELKYAYFWSDVYLDGAIDLLESLRDVYANPES